MILQNEMVWRVSEGAIVHHISSEDTILILRCIIEGRKKAMTRVEIEHK